MTFQPAILPGVPPVARYLTFSVRADAEAAVTRALVAALEIDNHTVVGIGEPLLAHWGGSVGGARSFPALSGPEVEVPSTQQALWCWLGGADLGDLVNKSIAIVDALADGFKIEQVVDGFKHGDAELGKDLTGYEDGTENPTGDDAVDAAFVAQGDLAGSSFVAVQQWNHDLRAFSAFPQPEQDNIIGRRKSDNEELEDAPDSAHTKRTEQESFTPEAFVVRRSMPFATPDGEGLMFVAFGHSFDAFEVQLKRMAGLEDGITDALFRFSTPVTGGYYWCPPVAGNRLDLGGIA